MFSKIWSRTLNNYTPPQSTTGSDIKELPIKKINLFIGQNNSGKSRFIRHIFSEEESKLEFYVGEENYKKIIQVIEPLLDRYFPDETITYKNSISGRELHEIHNKKISSLLEHKRYLDGVKSILEALNLVHHDQILLNQPGFTQVTARFKKNMADIYKIMQTLDDLYIPEIFPSRYYFPILRGLRPVGTTPLDDTYARRTIADYFHPPKSNDCNIVTGHDLYELFTSHLLGKPELRAKIKKYEELLGEYFFENETITIIPEHKQDTIAVQIGNSEQRPIYHLGDGLQQIIAITSKAFLTTEPSLLFIEEPELSLHPGMLRQLAVFLIEKTPHQYFVTTHSNHLLDLSESHSEVAIFKLKKELNPENEENFIISECNNDRTILSELGVHPSSVYLANCTIWVEGITDRLYLRFFMQKYLSELADLAEKENLSKFKENYHYAFVEYQGGTLGHWNFDDDDVDGNSNAGLCAIKACPEALVICDGDIRTKVERLRNLDSQLKDRLHILEGKEIENILPAAAIVSVACDRFENMKGMENYSKEKILALESHDDHFLHENDGIGLLLDKALDVNLVGKGKAEVRKFADESGTIKRKVEFCREIINKMESSDVKLTNEITRLCQRVFKHIHNNNI